MLLSQYKVSARASTGDSLLYYLSEVDSRARAMAPVDREQQARLHAVELALKVSKVFVCCQLELTYETHR